jgi:hypothetical protein
LSEISELSIRLHRQLMQVVSEIPPTSCAVKDDFKKTDCLDCGAIRECLVYALIDPTAAGIWGGTNDTERIAIRMERRKG